MPGPATRVNAFQVEADNTAKHYCVDIIRQYGEAWGTKRPVDRWAALGSPAVDVEFVELYAEDNGQRKKMVDWMLRVAQIIELKDETVHHAIDIMDGFAMKLRSGANGGEALSAELARRTARQKQLWAVCVVIAIKYREPEPFISSSPVQFLQEILDDNIEEADFLALEIDILNALHFRLTMPSICDILMFFSARFELSESEYQAALFAIEHFTYKPLHYGLWHVRPLSLVLALVFICKDVMNLDHEELVRKIQAEETRFGLDVEAALERIRPSWDIMRKSTPFAKGLKARHEELVRVHIARQGSYNLTKQWPGRPDRTPARPNNLLNAMNAGNNAGNTGNSNTGGINTLHTPRVQAPTNQQNTPITGNGNAVGYVQSQLRGVVSSGSGSSGSGAASSSSAMPLGESAGGNNREDRSCSSSSSSSSRDNHNFKNPHQRGSTSSSSSTSASSNRAAGDFPSTSSAPPPVSRSSSPDSSSAPASTPEFGQCDSSPGFPASSDSDGNWMDAESEGATDADLHLILPSGDALFSLNGDALQGDSKIDDGLVLQSDDELKTADEVNHPKSTAQNRASKAKQSKANQTKSNKPKTAAAKKKAVKKGGQKGVAKAKAKTAAAKRKPAQRKSQKNGQADESTSSANNKNPTSSANNINSLEENESNGLVARLPSPARRNAGNRSNVTLADRVQRGVKNQRAGQPY